MLAVGTLIISGVRGSHYELWVICVPQGNIHSRELIGFCCISSAQGRNQSLVMTQGNLNKSNQNPSRINHCHHFKPFSQQIKIDNG